MPARDTTNLIGNALYAWLDGRMSATLIQHPELARSAVEEVLRFESSNQLGNRAVVEESESAWVEMPKGTLVTLCIGAANRDGEPFPDSDRFDVARNPTRHLAFGSESTCARMSLPGEGRFAIQRS